MSEPDPTQPGQDRLEGVRATKAWSQLLESTNLSDEKLTELAVSLLCHYFEAVTDNHTLAVVDDGRNIIEIFKKPRGQLLKPFRFRSTKIPFTPLT